MIRVDDNKIMINEKTLVFNCSILEAVQINNKLIIVFDTEKDNGIDNVYCFNFYKKRLWRIQQVPRKLGGSAPAAYVGVDVKDGQCRVVDFFGRRFVVDVNDGRIISKDIVW